MSAPRLWVLLAVLLAGVVGAESVWPSGATPADDGTGVVPTRRPPLPTAAAAAPLPEDGARVDGWVGGILARPLFASDRRPADQPAATAAAAPALPRLSGVAVSPLGRTAIFATAAGGKPLVVAAGERVAGYVVASIEPGAVTLIGPDGSRTLAPALDASRPRPVPPPVPPPAPPAITPLLVPAGAMPPPDMPMMGRSRPGAGADAPPPLYPSATP